MRKLPARWLRWTAAATLACASPASAQLLGGSLGGITGGLPRSPLEAPPVVRGLPRTVGSTAGAALADVRRLTTERLIREHPEAVEADDNGAPVVRGEVLALSP